MAAVVSFATAVLLCGMALFRVGSLMKFVSPSVLTGFVTGRYTAALPPSLFSLFPLLFLPVLESLSLLFSLSLPPSLDA